MFEIPAKSKRFCLHQGCKELVDGTYCQEHKKKMGIIKESRKDNSLHNMYNYRWQKYRLQFLKQEPLCRECLLHEVLSPASVVDHIKPHRGDLILFWDIYNHQSLCKQCHDRKTVLEDGGFGNRLKIKGRG